MFLVQSIDRTMYYFSYPVSINLKINHNRTLRFPSVTICNENTFRASAAFDLGHYNFLDVMYSETSLKDFDYKAYGVGNITFTYLVNETAHQKEDMIVSCMWGSYMCSHKDFITKQTDFGICYTFNWDSRSQYSVSQTGVDEGLQLLLNVEKYEYMAGPYSAAGLHILLHEPDDEPLVKDVGSAIPTGFASFVGTTVTEVHNLPAPYDNCTDTDTLQYYSMYSKNACMRECMTSYVTQKCSCKDDYMPGDFPVCTFEQYINCIVPVIGDFEKGEDTKCQCQISCFYTTYETDITYATTSSRNADKFLRGPTAPHLKKKYLKALEVLQRVKPPIIEADEELISGFTETYTGAMSLVEKVESICWDVEDYIHSLLQDIKPRVRFHEGTVLQRIKYAIHHNFIRGYQYLAERTLDHVTTEFNEFVQLLREYFSLNNGHDVLYGILLKEIKMREMLALRARYNFTSIMKAYMTGTSISNYTNSLNDWYDMSFIPTYIVTGVTGSLREYMDNIMQALNASLESLNIFHVNLPLVAQKKKFNLTAVNIAMDNFIRGSKDYNFEKYRISDRIIRQPEYVWDKRIAAFLKHNNTLYSLSDDMNQTCNILLATAKEFKGSTGKLLHDTVLMANTYLNNQSMNKLDLAHQMVSDLVIKGVGATATLVQDLDFRGTMLDDTWNYLSEAYQDLWRNMLEENATKPFYEMIHNDFLTYTATNDPAVKTDMSKYFNYFLELKSYNVVLEQDIKGLERMLNADFAVLNVKTKEEEITVTLEGASRDWNIGSMASDDDELFTNAAEALQESLQKYLDETELNEAFFRNNFLQLNVYMQQMSYQDIRQQAAYDVVSLLSDFGGSMGLFIGASVLTIVEVLDVVFHTLAMKTRKHKRSA